MKRETKMRRMILVAASLLAVSSPALAQETCKAMGTVYRLNSNGKNNLSVRMSPSGQAGLAYEKDELFSGDKVCVANMQGVWDFVIYERGGRALSGWVHSNYIDMANGAASRNPAAPAEVGSYITDGHFRLSYSVPGSLVMGSIIEVDGEIVAGDADSFDRLVAKTKGPIAVVFKSPGGVLMEGLRIGQTIKNHAAITTVSGSCASACAYAWLAGRKRAMSPGAEVIFHSPYQRDDASHADGTANVVVGQYLAEMGIDMKTSMTITGHDPRSYYVIDAGDPAPIISFTVTGGE